MRAAGARRLRHLLARARSRSRRVRALRGGRDQRLHRPRDRRATCTRLDSATCDERGLHAAAADHAGGRRRRPRRAGGRRCRSSRSAPGPSAGVAASAVLADRRGEPERDRRPTWAARASTSGSSRRPAGPLAARRSSTSTSSSSRALTSSRSARAAARSSGCDERAGTLRVGPRAPAPTPGRPATAAAASGRRSPTPTSCSGYLNPDELPRRRAAARPRGAEAGDRRGRRRRSGWTRVEAAAAARADRRVPDGRPDAPDDGRAGHGPARLRRLRLRRRRRRCTSPASRASSAASGRSCRSATSRHVVGVRLRDVRRAARPRARETLASSPSTRPRSARSSPSSSRRARAQLCARGHPAPSAR